MENPHYKFFLSSHIFLRKQIEPFESISVCITRGKKRSISWKQNNTNKNGRETETERGRGFYRAIDFGLLEHPPLISGDERNLDLECQFIIKTHLISSLHRSKARILIFYKTTINPWKYTKVSDLTNNSRLNPPPPQKKKK